MVGVVRASAATSVAPDPVLAGKALAALSAAGRYFMDVLSVQGAYVYEYSDDLSIRRGEGEAGPTTGWVQPPGTPAVGAAFLRLYELTGEKTWLGAAHQAGRALVQTQLLSGGWYYSMEMSPEAGVSWCYRARGLTPDECKDIEGNKHKNRSVLDDDTTQSVIRFLIWLDNKLDGSDPAIRESVVYALDRMVALQYPIGSWPAFPEPRRKDDDAPVNIKATAPENWSRTYVKPEGGPYYILNDNLVRDMVHALLLAERYLGDGRYADSAVLGGEFLLRAQLPAPHPGWAQTYNERLEPVWGRKFEPPAVASRETAGAAAALLELYSRNGDKRFLDAAKQAAGWLEQVRLADGTWARFYELGTNRPLYVDSALQLTYETTDLHPGYGYFVEDGIEDVLAKVARAAGGETPPPPPFWPSAANALGTEADLESAVRAIVSKDDGSGRWVEDGWIRSQSFIDAVFIVGRYIESRL